MPKWQADKSSTEGLGKDSLSTRSLSFPFHGSKINFLQEMRKTLSITFCGSLTLMAMISSVSKSSCWRWILPTVPPVSSNYHHAVSNTSLQKRKSSTGRSSYMTLTTTDWLTSERWPSSCRPWMTSRGSNQGRTTETETQIMFRRLLKERLRYLQLSTGTTTVL